MSAKEMNADCWVTVWNITGLQFDICLISFNKRERNTSAREMNADHEIDIISDVELLTGDTSHNF